MKYPKINSLWKRNNKGIIIENDYACEEFTSISNWLVTEKVDGTNIRIIFNPVQRVIDFKGRTDNAIIPPHLLEHLQSIFTTKKFLDIFPDGKEIVLFGEGYGNKIQKCVDKYSDKAEFILFDVVIDGLWLRRESVADIASKLNLCIVPALSITTKDDIIALVKQGFNSLITKQELVSEGVVVRSDPLMLFRNGTPIMWKLKHKDYVKLHLTTEGNK